MNSATQDLVEMGSISTASSATDTPGKREFHGRNIILCNGGIVMGKDWSWLLLTGSLLLFPLTLFCIFALPPVVNQFGKWLLAPMILNLLFTFYFGLRTSWSDPGILPRHTDPRDNIKLIQNDQIHERLVFHTLNPNYLIAKEVLTVIKDLPKDQWPRYQLKYCNTCEIFRPNHASHCARCDNCVEGFDHHCQWLANCVGRRNYRRFLLFVLFVLLMALYVVILSTFHLLYTWSKCSLAANVIIGVISAYALLITFLLSILLFYHLSIIGRGLTTAEHIRSINSGENTSQRKNDCLTNLVRLYCEPKPRRQVDWNQYETRRELKV